MDGIDLSEIFMSMGLGGGFGSSQSSRRSHGAIRPGEMVLLHGLNKAKDWFSSSSTAFLEGFHHVSPQIFMQK